MTKFRGVVEAKEGWLLLGGVKRHVSSTFRDGRTATRWAVVVAQVNKDAGRKVGLVRTEVLVDGAWVDAAE